MGEPKRILVIDDEVAIQAILRGCFEDLAGWQVSTAGSGQEGYQKAIAEQPDAIVLDIMMPDMDGITVLHHLRANQETELIPVVLITAKVELISLKDYSTYGIVDAIAKPFDPFQLVEKISASLGWPKDVSNSNVTFS